MNAVIYARYSNGPRQTEQSIEGQLRDCKEYAEKHDIDIVGTYIDRAISGTDFIHRAEFNRLMSDCSKHKFDAVIVWKIDRFGRNREEIALNKVKLKKHGISLHYAKEHIPDGPEGIILESLLEGMAEYYSAELSQKVMRGLRESVLKGHVLGANPLFGYRIEEKRYKVDELTAPIVREIFERYADGESGGSIVRDLNERHITTAKGNKFRDNYIYAMVRNEKYIGIYKYGEDIVLYDAIEPIISMELWAKVQARNERNKFSRSRSKATSDVPFILTGKLYCGLCGCGMSADSGRSHSGSMYYYYKCGNQKHKAKSAYISERCKQKSYRKEMLEDWVVYETVEKVLTDDMINSITQKIVEIQKNDEQVLLIDSLNQKLKATEKAINNMMKVIESGLFTESMADRLRALEEEKSQIKSDIVIAEIKRPEVTEEQIIYMLEKMREGNVNDQKFRERIVDSFISSITIFEDHAIVVYNMNMEDENRLEAEYSLEQIKRAAEHVRLLNVKQG